MEPTLKFFCQNPSILHPISLPSALSATDRRAAVPGHDEEGSVWLPRVPGDPRQGARAGEDGQRGENEETVQSRGF